MGMRIRRALLVLTTLLYVSTWPGLAANRALDGPEDALAPLRTGLERLADASRLDRDGILDVMVRSEDGSPLVGAVVRALAILDGRGRPAGVATTVASGVARLTGLPRAEHWIVADAPGHGRASQKVVIEGDLRRLELTLGPAHRLDVRVVAEAGEPIDAELEVVGRDPFPVGARARTEGDGAHIDGLSAGPYVVTARSPGYDEAVRRDVAEGTPVVLTLGRKGRLVVSVVGLHGEAVEGARVLVASPSLGPPRMAQTSPGGTASIGGLDAGAYSLRATHGALVSPLEVGLSLGKGEIRNVELRLAPGRFALVHVVDAQTQGDIRGAAVAVAEGGVSSFPLEGVTDRRGLATLGPIEKGTFTVSAEADGFSSGVLEATDDAVTMLLARAGTIAGRVVDRRGLPVDGATLRIVGTGADGMPIDEDPTQRAFRGAYFDSALAGPSKLLPAGELGYLPGPIPALPHPPHPGSPPGSQTTDTWTSGRDGGFRVTSAPPGRIRIAVHHPQYVNAMSEVVSLASGHEARVDVILARGGTLEGRIVDTRGHPVAGVSVSALATRGADEHVTRTDDRGTFAFASVADSLVILASRDETFAHVAARAEVTVPDEARKAIELTLPDIRESLTVRVRTKRREAIAFAQVTATSIDPSESLRVTAFTDDRGDASLEGARGLPLRMEVRAPGYAARAVETRGDAATVVIELSPAEVVVGHVSANRREPIEGATVSLSTEASMLQGRTDRGGAFTLRDVPPGTVHLRVEAAGRAPLERDVVIAGRHRGRSVDLGSIELVEEASVEGTVVDGRGLPVVGARVGSGSVSTYVPADQKGFDVAVTDANGHFRLARLGAGTLRLEAYSADQGRGQIDGVQAAAGRTTRGVTLVVHEAAAKPETFAPGGVAITLGEARSETSQELVVIVVAVASGSEAERAGIRQGDVIETVGGAPAGSLETARDKLSGPTGDDVRLSLVRGGEAVHLRVRREAVRR